VAGWALAEKRFGWGRDDPCDDLDSYVGHDKDHGANNQQGFQFFPPQAAESMAKISESSLDHKVLGLLRAGDAKLVGVIEYPLEESSRVSRLGILEFHVALLVANQRLFLVAAFDEEPQNHAMFDDIFGGMLGHIVLGLSVLTIVY
jgi:hypothetical protein